MKERIQTLRDRAQQTLELCYKLPPTVTVDEVARRKQFWLGQVQAYDAVLTIIGEELTSFKNQIERILV